MVLLLFANLVSHTYFPTHFTSRKTRKESTVVIQETVYRLTQTSVFLMHFTFNFQLHVCVGIRTHVHTHPHSISPSGQDKVIFIFFFPLELSDAKLS